MVQSIPKEDKTFYMALILTAGVFATMIGGGLGFVYGNAAWTDYWRNMLTILLAPAGIYWGLYQNRAAIEQRLNAVEQRVQKVVS